MKQPSSHSSKQRASSLNKKMKPFLLTAAASAAVCASELQSHSFLTEELSREKSRIHRQHMTGDMPRFFGGEPEHDLADILWC